MGDERQPTGPVPRPVTETGALHHEVGYLEAKLDGLKEIVELRMDQFSEDIKSLPCRGKAECPAPPKKSASSEYPKVPKPEAAPGQEVSINQLIDWMDRLSVASAARFKRWAFLLGGLVAAMVGSSAWKSCDVEGRLAALAARPPVVQPVAVPAPVIVRMKPDVEVP